MGPCRRYRGNTTWAAALPAALLMAFGGLLAGAHVSPSAAAGPPNIVFLLADDLDERVASGMPRLQELAQSGTRFSKFYVTTPICVPSRATILTGKYTQNTNVRRNTPPFGGYQTFFQDGLEGRTIAVALQQAGYRTGFSRQVLQRLSGAGRAEPCPAGLGLLGQRAPGRQQQHPPQDQLLPERERRHRLLREPAGRLRRRRLRPQGAGVRQLVRRPGPALRPVSVARRRTPLSGPPRGTPTRPWRRSCRAPPPTPRPASPTSRATCGCSRNPRRCCNSRTAATSSASRWSCRWTTRSVRCVRSSASAACSRTPTSCSAPTTAGTTVSTTCRPTRAPATRRTSGCRWSWPAGRARRAEITRMVGNADLAPTFAAWTGAPLAPDADGRSLVGLMTSPSPDLFPWRGLLPIARLGDGVDPATTWPLYTPRPGVTVGYRCLSQVPRWPIPSDHTNRLPRVAGRADRSVHLRPARHRRPRAVRQRHRAVPGEQPDLQRPGRPPRRAAMADRTAGDLPGRPAARSRTSSAGFASAQPRLGLGHARARGRRAPPARQLGVAGRRRWPSGVPLK